jgi:hypothetical protein
MQQTTLTTPEANPLISLVIPAWNEAAFLPRLLDSVDAARRRYRGGAGKRPRSRPGSPGR